MGHFYGAQNLATQSRHEEESSGEIECGLVILPVAVEGLEIEPLFKDEVFFVSTTRSGEAGDVSIEEMSQANLILYDAHTGWKDPTRKQILDRAKLAGVVIDPAIEVEHVETAISLVSSGAGDSFVSRSVIDTPSFPLNVRTFRFDPPLYDTIALARRTGSIISPATKKFAELAASKLLKYQKARNLMGGGEGDA
jgi:DNA-binding transcriptional LysR family regulator